MRSETIDIQTSDGVVDAYLTRPDDGDRHPGVLFIMRADFFKQVRPLMNQLTPERIGADGAAYLNELGGVADEPVAITGYCMGVRLGLRIAAAHPDRVAALAGFHGGGLVTDDPQSPHRSVDALRAELYFGHADQDPSNNLLDRTSR